MFICKECNKYCDTYEFLRKHRSILHKIHSPQTYADYYLNGQWPLCKCGCGEKVKWRSEKPAHFMEYVQGHNSRINNPMEGKAHSEKSRQNMSKTRKEKFANGEAKIWCEGLSVDTNKLLQRAAIKISNNKDRSKKISIAMKGKSHSIEWNNNSRMAIIEAWKNPELRNKQRQNRIEWLNTKGFNKESKLETTFKNILSELNISYTFQYPVEGFMFDFLIPDKDVLIEVDGNFYHCNPETHPYPVYDVQKQVLENDKNKNIVAKNSGFKLLRFWEKDIKSRPEWVKEQLLLAISS